MTHDPMAGIRASFFVECEELLENLQDSLAILDRGEDDGETVNIMFRAVHSIKGGAGAFGLSPLVAFAHRYETVLDELRAGRLKVCHDVVRLFFHAADLLHDQVCVARDGGTEPAGSEDCLRDLEALIENAPASEPDLTDFQPMKLALSFDFNPDIPPAFWKVIFTPLPALYQSGNEPLYLLRTLSSLGDAVIACDLGSLAPLSEMDPENTYLTWTVHLKGQMTKADILEVFDFVEDVCQIEIIDAETGERDPENGAKTRPQDAAAIALPGNLALTTPSPPAQAPPLALQAPSPREPVAATVRVDLNRIDRLVNLVGELVINQAMLAQNIAEAHLPPNSKIMTELESFMVLTRDIQDSVMMIRAQPVKPLFQRMARIVREASASIGKEVRLKCDGEATEVDRTVIERLADPLTHMIRNALDHGLEMPDDREAVGKPREGVITLSAQHRAGRVVIEVSDDGAGIDRPKVRKIAITKGLIPADLPLEDGDIDNLLFMPGFSTTSTVSALSGRGVGMDVVRSAIQALGGRITITSDVGSGTTFSISLPLTLAVLDGMIVTVAGETLVVPLSSILETVALKQSDIRTIGTKTSVIHLRGAFVPIYDLGVELGYRETKACYDGGIILLTSHDDGRKFALIVDTIHDQRQVVIKGLHQSYGHIPGIAAATILGNGQIALILDPVDLVENAASRTSAAVYTLAG
ncbi:chemotaxis protein CheA [Phaeovulum sp.]|uniref:chemotaxis protein CheA n=1 Tax=Phaeovulum sp. TaxID=2934796 RepID=UPI0039E570BD